MATYSAPQINIYTADVERSLRFYTGLGFEERFRYAPDGPPVHVELVLDGFTLGIADVEAARADHGLKASFEGQAVEVVLWCDDTDRAFAELTRAGAPALSAPHDWLGHLRLAWVGDPDGNPVQLAQRRS
jgi:catechol 2,3-dioxygenase-like lactoylglutathione lyase family enzyme